MSVRPSHIEYELQHLKSNEAEINILLQMAANRTPITPLSAFISFHFTLLI